MPTTSLPPTSGPTTVTSAYAVPPMNATSVVPPRPMNDFGRPLANVVISPVLGSTREILPAALSVTYNARPGPTVLPEPPSRPVSSWVGLGASDGGAALAADGVIIPITAAANNSNSLRWRPIGPSSRLVALDGRGDAERSIGIRAEISRQPYTRPAHSQAPLKRKAGALGTIHDGGEQAVSYGSDRADGLWRAAPDERIRIETPCRVGIAVAAMSALMAAGTETPGPARATPLFAPAVA